MIIVCKNLILFKDLLTKKKGKETKLIIFRLEKEKYSLFQSVTVMCSENESARMPITVNSICPIHIGKLHFHGIVTLFSNTS